MARGTCRCPMCGKKDSSKKKMGRGSYIKCGVRCNEDGVIDNEHKRQGRRLRRQREGRNWREEYEMEVEADILELEELLADMYDYDGI